MDRLQQVDAYAPAEIARRVHDVGIAKAKLDLASLLALSVLAGAFIGLGACFSTLAVSGVQLGYGFQRLVAGLTFSLGLILVVVAGAELFTGNNLVVMAWASRAVTTADLLRSWFWVIPMGLLLKGQPAVLAAGGWTPQALGPLSLAGFVRNLVPVTLGNIVGGGLLVAGMYWFIYLRKAGGPRTED